MIGACVWYDLTSNYIFQEAEISLRTLQTPQLVKTFLCLLPNSRGS